MIRHSPFFGLEKLSKQSTKVHYASTPLSQARLTLTLVASVYDFASAGVGSFTFEPRTGFLVAKDQGGAFVEGRQGFSLIDPSTVHAEPFTVQITDIPSGAAGLPSTVEKRATNLCLNKEKRQKIASRHVSLTFSFVSPFVNFKAATLKRRISQEQAFHSTTRMVSAPLCIRRTGAQILCRRSIRS